MSKLLALVKNDFKKPAQTLADFAREYKELDAADKLFFLEAYEAEGTTVDDADEIRAL